MADNWGVTRGTLVRIEDDGKGQQRIVARGVKGEEFTGIYRAQTFGFTSSPPVGADLMLRRMGSSERIIADSVEAPGKRPVSKPEEYVAIYGGDGEVASLVQRKYRVKTDDKQVFVVGDKYFRITALGIFTNLPITAPVFTPGTPPKVADDEV